MKKKILSIAVLLAAFMGSTAIAQTPATTVQTQKSERMAQRREARPNPFEGIDLTEKQQAEMKALREGIMAERKKIASEEKAEKKDMLEQRKKDTKEYLAKIKEILTPEQYVQFLENSYLNQVSSPFGMQPGKHGQRPGMDGQQGQRPGKDGKKGQRGQRPDKAQD